MSATGRGERGGGGLDFFPTPAWCVDWLLRAVDLPGYLWLEPSAGDGAIIRAVRARRDRRLHWAAVEIRPECEENIKAAAGSDLDIVRIDDFTRAKPPPGPPYFHVCIGNPPFGLAEQFIGRALLMARTVAFLLRLNFLGSQKRCDFWRRHPADVYVLSERPSFDGEGTDATEYAWFVWGQCGSGPGRIRVLGPDDSQLPLLSASPG